MPESLRISALRWAWNFWPCFRRTGARITYIASDWSEVRVSLGLNWRTRNYVGTIYGGSLYAAVDPFYMLMLIQRLGRDYTVWDKAATIHFRRPGRGTLTASFRLDEGELETIRGLLRTEPRIDRSYRVTLEDAEGTVHVEVEKLIHIRRKDPAQA
jgi:acyl-coenzyme A thioesterase PaaI-like protein